MKAVCILLQNPYDIDMRVRRKASLPETCTRSSAIRTASM